MMVVRIMLMVVHLVARIRPACFSEVHLLHGSRRRETIVIAAPVPIALWSE